MPWMTFLLYTTEFKSRLWMATHSEIGRQPKQSEKRELSQLAIYRIHIFVFPVIKESVQKISGCTLLNPFYTQR